MDARLAFSRGSDLGAERSTASRAPAHARCVTFAVGGLYYEHCEIGLAYQLHGSRGIIDVVVDSRAGTASITFDEQQMTEKAVEHLISECGYELDGRDRLGRTADNMRAPDAFRDAVDPHVALGSQGPRR
jgi:hypothetical protein